MIEQFAALDETRFMHSEILQRAFARSLEVIGEAAKNINEEYRLKHRSVDWKMMAGMRDVLIHKYFGVDYGIVWDVVENKIPELKKQIVKLLEEEE